MNNKITLLVRLFGSTGKLAKAAGINKAAVFRWPPVGGISRDRQFAVLTEAREQGMDLEQVAWALDVERCHCCGSPVDARIADLLDREKTDA